MAGFFLHPFQLPQTIESGHAGLHQALIEIGEMHRNNALHHVRLRKGDMMKIAPAEKRIGQILFGVGGYDHHRSMKSGNGLVDFHDVELHLIKHVEHIILKIGIGLVDLVDEQYHALLCGKRLADLAHADVILNAADIAAGIGKPAVVETGQGIVLV